MSMATVYRDYGAMGHYSIPENQVEITPRRQVYQATHEGEARLPFMNRSFISFTYGGRHIEDFNLIATTSGDRLERNGYSSFNDLITSYDNLDGQYYWGTHYKTNSITFNLATDGINQKELDDFLHWFCAGVSRELILAEHPNRAQMARVSEPPQLSLLPFETIIPVTLKVDSTQNIENNDETQGIQTVYDIHTTLYKGEITLNLIMDEPHWYAKDNILGILTEKDGRMYYEDKFVDANGQIVDVLQSPDALKILYEDGIPLGSAIENNMLLGNKAYAAVQDLVETKIWSPQEDYVPLDDGMPVVGEGARIEGTITEEDYWHSSREVMTNENQIGLVSENGTDLKFNMPSDFIPDWREYNAGTYLGRIAGAIIDASENGITLLQAYNKGEPNIGYFFYAGTAPSPTIIRFTLDIGFNDDGYINAPSNKIGTRINNRTNDDSYYNSIIITSETQQILKFTTPNLLTSYNQLIKILDEKVDSKFTWENIYNEIRDKVRHPAIRTWAARILDATRSETSELANVDLRQLKNNMQYFFFDHENMILPMTFTFNSKTGAATGLYQYRTPSNIDLNNMQESGEIIDPVEEDVGDMLYSNYIILKDRNYPNNFGKFVNWEDTPLGHKYSHSIIHDYDSGLRNVQVEYQTMYL